MHDLQELAAGYTQYTDTVTKTDATLDTALQPEMFTITITSSVPCATSIEASITTTVTVGC